MKLFERTPNPPTEVDNAALLQEKCVMLLRSLTATLHFLKTFALDVEEIQSQRFKEEIQEITDRFMEPDKPQRQEMHFEQQKQRILSYIDRQHSYIKDREKELRDIIDLLAKAIASLNVENRDFYQRINKQGEKILKISGLDDIKKIKNSLKAEVEQMWEIVSLKQDQEKCQVRMLAGQVHCLQDELEKAKAKAMTDGLTGIYNREALDDFLADRIARSPMMSSDFCLMMIDIDDFKLINDRYGHMLGDRVLVALSQKCRASIRNDDFLARYGGEEFTIVLENANFRNALKKAQQLCTAIASVRYATSESQNDDYLSMSISIGVTQFKKGDTPSDIISRADRALYDAKRKGKNCVVGRKS